MNTSNSTTLARFAFLALAFVFVIPERVTAQGIYTPLSVPCRSMDTRVGDEFIQANEIRFFSVDPLFSSLQGGTANCGVPAEADVVKLTVHGIALTNKGFFRIFDARLPGHLQNYSSMSINSTSYSTAHLDIPVGGERQIAIYSPVVAAHAVAEIVGYYLNE